MNRILHFLKNFPAWVVLLGLVIFFVVLYNWKLDSAYKEWTSLVLASLFTALGIQRPQNQTQNQSANTNSGDVIVSTDSEAENAEEKL